MLRSRRTVCVLLLLALAAQASLASASTPSAPPAPTEELERIGAALLDDGHQAVVDWGRHEKKQMWRLRLFDLATMSVLLGAASLEFAAARDPIIGMTGLASTHAVTGYVLTTLWASFGVFSMSYYQQLYQAALENAGGYRGWYVARAIRIAPRSTVLFGESIEDPSLRSKVLGAVLASAAVNAPKAAETAADSLVNAMRQNDNFGENMHTIALVLPTCSPLGPDHPAVVTCVEFLAEVLSEDALRRPSPDVVDAASAYAYFRPADGVRLTTSMAGAKDKCRVLVSAANGALREGDSEGAAGIVEMAVNEAQAARDTDDRVEALSHIAASAAAAGRRATLVSQAVDAARSAQSRHDRTGLSRKIALALAPVDVEAALSVLTDDDRPFLHTDFARALVPLALRCGPSEAHATLVERLPRNHLAAACFANLASALSQSDSPVLRAAAEEAALLAVHHGAGLRETPEERQVILEGLTALAVLNPELACESMPERQRRRDPPLFAQSHLRVAGTIAAQLSQAPPESSSRELRASVIELMRAGFACAPSPRDMHCGDGYMAEVPLAVTAVFRIAPSELRGLIGDLPPGNLHAAVVVECGVAEALAGSPQARGTLAEAILEAQRVRDPETRDALLSRASIGLNILDPDAARTQISQLEIPWARAAAWATIAGLSDGGSSPARLNALSAATTAAAASDYAEHRATAVLWTLHCAASSRDDFARAAREAGLPWLVPVGE